MSKTKFNVDKDKEKRTCNGIVFDSVMEMRYYEEVLLPLVESGDVVKYELQKPYELQPKFLHDEKTVHPITYVADFFMQYKDGHEVVIDVKGCPDTTAIIKRKLFWYKYPNIQYDWVTHVKKFGGWLGYDECKKLRKDAKRQQQME